MTKQSGPVLPSFIEMSVMVEVLLMCSPTVIGRWNESSEPAHIRRGSGTGGMKMSVRISLGELIAVMGVSEAAIGLTMGAVGTSLPELVTALIAAYRKEMDVILGNVIGSNIFNVLGVLGATLLVTVKEISTDNFSSDMIVFLLVTLAVAPFLLFFGHIRFLVGVAFLTRYVAYVGWIYQGDSL